MRDVGGCPVPNGALQAHVFIDLPGTIRKDGLCTPADLWGGRVHPSFLLLSRGLLEGREFRSEESGVMNFDNRPPGERGRLGPLEGHFSVFVHVCTCSNLSTLNSNRGRCLGNTRSTTSITTVQLDRPKACQQRYPTLQCTRKMTDAACRQQGHMSPGRGLWSSRTKRDRDWPLDLLRAVCTRLPARA